MALIAAIKARLEGDASITAIVSTRIYNRQVPPTAAFPYIVLRMTDREEVDHMTGSHGEGRSMVDLVCVGRENAAQLESLAGLIRARLHMRRWTQGSVVVSSSRKESESDENDAPLQGQNFGLLARIQRYALWHNVAATTWP